MDRGQCPDHLQPGPSVPPANHQVSRVGAGGNIGGTVNTPARHGVRKDVWGLYKWTEIPISVRRSKRRRSTEWRLVSSTLESSPEDSSGGAQ